MRRAAQSAPTRSRSRRKSAEPAPATPSAPPRNVGSVEALLSLTLGVLMLVAALVPRTFKQLFLLGFGGALAYRGLTGNCEFYQALGIDTARGSLPDQAGGKPRAAVKD